MAVSERMRKWNARETLDGVDGRADVKAVILERWTAYMYLRSLILNRLAMLHAAASLFCGP